MATALGGQGLAVRFDQKDLRPGSDLTAYMETAVRESDRVLLICTPAFARRADQRVGGVGYEQAIVTGEMFTGVAHPENLLRGDPAESLPSYLRSRVWMDFRDDSQFEADVAELVSAVTDGSAKDPPEDQVSPVDEDLRVYREAAEFARSKQGMALTKAEAIQFAETVKEGWPLKELRLFTRVFRFANGDMRLSRADAEDFALEWMQRADPWEFDAYRELFAFVRSKDGLSLGAGKAHDFVEEFDASHGLSYGARFRQAFQVAKTSGRSRAGSEEYARDQL